MIKKISLVVLFIVFSFCLISCNDNLNGNNNQEEPDKTVHEHTIESIPTVHATCTTTGLTEGKKCSVCGEIITNQVEIPKIKHHFKNGKCTMCGIDNPNHLPLEGDIEVPEYLIEQGVTEEIYLAIRPHYPIYPITKYLGKYNSVYVVWYEELTPATALVRVEEVAGMVYIGSEYFGLKVLHDENSYNLQEALDNNLLTVTDLEEIFIAYYGYEKDKFVCEKGMSGNVILGLQTRYNLLLEYYEEILNINTTDLTFEKDCVLSTSLILKEEETYIIKISDGRSNLETIEVEIGGLLFKIKDYVPVVYHGEKLYSLLDAYNNKLITENNLVNVYEYFK